MRITDVRLILTSPGANYLTVKVITDDGLYGLGDATLVGRELAVATYLEEYVIPMLIGRDPSAIEDTWQLLGRSAYWRRGPVHTTAQSAIDMALWDIKGKELGAPVYQLLGGRSRRGVLAYSHASGIEIAQAVDAMHEQIAAGYRAVRLQCGVPGLPSTYGVVSDESDQPRAPHEVPYEESWNTAAYLETAPKLFAAARDAVGMDVHLLHDAHHRLTSIEAAALGKSLEPYRLFWLEDPVQADDQTAFRLVRQHTTTPLAVGEVVNHLSECQTLISERLIDYIRATVVHAGGITGLRRIAAFAEPFGVRTGCHGAPDMSPVTLAAALHTGISTHNVGIQEHGRHTSTTDEVFPHAYTFADGYLDPGEAPGLGVDIDEGLAARFEYRRKYLPTTRLVDGTMWNW
ncbi:D-mannonate dehydratase ManD [Ruania alba]|uniref:D-mannonate dehydratase n=1 Tax=Ruania alba TaxID=648782 RepID=A0A1H5K9Z2_9MICO|nr:D-mannonate dehydratase ManD [Ruania alba]SEE61559.1 D-mannonate dehydratase [Ruania alba]